MMKVKIFAGLKAHLGHEYLTESVLDTKTLLEQLISEYPEAKELLLSSRIVVNQTIIQENISLTGTEDIAILPPSSGG